jgi:serine phosphatase RsbU (regulator of sigma subunit)
MDASFSGASVETLALRTLVAHRAAVPAETTVEVMQSEFERAQVDFVAVLDRGELLGVCARRELAQALGSRFGFALNARQPVRGYLMAAPLRVSVESKMTEVFKAASARTDREFYDDVLLVDEAGRYVGMIPMRTLVRLQTQFLLGNIDRLEASRQEIAAKNREMEADLLMAREVQLAMLPQTHALISSSNVALRIAHRYQPAGSVSGDFFDVVRISENAVGVLICDVMGHGVRSALITAMIRAMLEELRPIAADPGLLLTRLNRDLTSILRQTGGLIFVTAAYAVVHLGFGKLSYAQAGHPTPLRSANRDGVVRTVACSSDSAGPALGLMDDFVFVSTEENFGVGDRVVLFTDGLFEASAANGEEFGASRLAESLTRVAEQPLDTALSKLLSDVTDYCGGAAFADDVCVVALEAELM